MTNPDEPIDYRYLNVDTKQFHESEADLLEEFKHNKKAPTKCVVPNYKHNQCLIAVGASTFTPCYAVIVCRKISGLL